MRVKALLFSSFSNHKRNVTPEILPYRRTRKKPPTGPFIVSSLLNTRSISSIDSWVHQVALFYLGVGLMGAEFPVVCRWPELPPLKVIADVPTGSDGDRRDVFCRFPRRNLGNLGKPGARLDVFQFFAGVPRAPGSAFLPGCRAGSEFEGGVTAPAIRPAEEVSGQLLAQRLSA